MDATLHALDILTEDCWREVFKKVWSPAELKSCSETCSTFEGILEGKKNTWMWHAILPHVLQYLSTPQGPGANQWRWGRNWNGLYNCRRVCKGWRQGVDQYLETNNDYFQGIAAPTIDCYRFDWQHDFQEFPEMYENFRGNPFIGRFMCVDMAGDLITHPQAQLAPNHDQQDDHIVNLRWMLTRFGHEIRSMFIEECFVMRHLSFCKNVHSLLSMLPNLKSLYLDPSSRREADLSQLSGFLATSPLPDHPHLENLSLNMLSIKMGGPLLEKYGPQLKRLQLREAKPFLENVGRFQHLEQLEVWSRSHGPKGRFDQLRQLQSPLRMLHIHVSFGHDMKSQWPIHELIRNLIHLPLTELWISTQNYIEGKLSSFPNSLQHGSIRRVKIMTFTTCAFSCNFLRCFPNLEQVDFDYPDAEIASPGSRNRSNLLNLTSLEDDMYASAIWDVLPHLQTITVKSREPKAYRRSTFEMLRLEKTKEILAELF